MRVGIGQDSHRFLENQEKKVCVIGGVAFHDVPGFDADSDGDVVYHAICNAITSLTHVQILGGKAIQMCKEGITNSKQYLLEAKNSLKQDKISYISISIEGKRPRMQASIEMMRKNISLVLGVGVEQVGITCTSGNHMGECGRGLGVQSYCILTLI